MLPLLVLVSACSGSAGTDDALPPCPKAKPTLATVPGLTGRIAYRTLAGGGGNCEGIFVINADGSGRQRITRPELYPSSIRWSPDGQQLTFSGLCAGRKTDEICVMNADGTGLRAVTQSLGHNMYPTWSPDGTRIAFSRRLESLGPGDLYTVGADGTGEVQLTNDDGDESESSWSPDGQSLFYIRKDGTKQLWSMPTTGGPTIRLVPDGTVNEGPVHSHDGRYIAFSSNRGGKAESEYGANVRKTPGGELLPRDLGGQDIYVIGSDGQGLTRLTEGSSSNYAATWSPDDQHIAFTSDRDGSQQLYVMAADGTGQVRLSRADDSAHGPSWTS